MPLHSMHHVDEWADFDEADDDVLFEDAVEGGNDIDAARATPADIVAEWAAGADVKAETARKHARRLRDHFKRATTQALPITTHRIAEPESLLHESHDGDGGDDVFLDGFGEDINADGGDDVLLDGFGEDIQEDEPMPDPVGPPVVLVPHHPEEPPVHIIPQPPPILVNQARLLSDLQDSFQNMSIAVRDFGDGRRENIPGRRVVDKLSKEPNTLLQSASIISVAKALDVSAYAFSTRSEMLAAIQWIAYLYAMRAAIRCHG